MATPSVSASLDKTTYAPGELMTLTVDYTVDPLTVTVVVDGLGGTSGPVVVPPVKVRRVTVADSAGKTWVLVSDDGSRAVYTATA